MEKKGWFDHPISQSNEVKRPANMLPGRPGKANFDGFYNDLVGPWRSDLPSGYVKIAIENDPFIVVLPINNGDVP